MADQDRHPGRNRAIAEFFTFAAIVGVTIGSAITAKERSGVGPALTRLAPAQGPAIQPNAATVDVVAHIESTVEAAVDAPASGEVAPIAAPEFAEADTRYFDGRPIRPARTIWMTVTAYSPDEQSCGIWADGVTASNKSVWTNAMKLVAADTSLLPFGTLLSVPGYDNGAVVPVLDRGGAIKGNRLDVLYPTHEIALEWGVQRLPVMVWEYAD